MPLLHIFNPGHETAVLLDSVSYTPPANVSVMTDDLACLPMWYADSEDAVIVDRMIDEDFIDALPKEIGRLAMVVTKDYFNRLDSSHNSFVAKPWGMSPHILNKYRRLNIKTDLLTVPVWDDMLKQLTGRQTAIECLNRIKQLMPSYSLPDVPECCKTVDELERLLQQKELPLVVKTPYSSSGRGIMWLRDITLSDAERKWISGAILKQGFVSVEKGLDKVADFAMEFDLDNGGNVSYEGLSLFATEGKGAYTGNRLANQETLHKEIADLVGETDLSTLQVILSDVLREFYAPYYSGCIGVDMMVYRKADNSLAIHPCVEINMRYTMGMVALQLFKHYVSPSAEGTYLVSFYKHEGMALDKHHELSRLYPLQIEQGRIVRGYLSLCPVNLHTNYCAYIIIG